jgi:hypothetical protein
MGNAVRPLAESYPVADQYVEGLGRVDKTGRNLRFTYFTERSATEEGEEPTFEVCARIVMPIEAVLPAIGMILKMKFFEWFDIANLMACISKSRERDRVTH